MLNEITSSICIRFRKYSTTKALCYKHVDSGAGTKDSKRFTFYDRFVSVGAVRQEERYVNI